MALLAPFSKMSLSDEEKKKTLTNILTTVCDIMKICNGNKVLENKAKESISKLIQETLREISLNKAKNRKTEEHDNIEIMGLSNEINQTINEFNSSNIPIIDILKEFIFSIRNNKEPIENMDMDEIYHYLLKNFTESELNEKLRLFLQSTDIINKNKY